MSKNTLLDRIVAGIQDATERDLPDEVAHLRRLRDSLLGVPTPGSLAKHASPTHGTGTSQKVHGNWAHPGYTDRLDPDSGDLTVTPSRGADPFTQTALFHPDLFDSAPELPKLPYFRESDPDLAHPFTNAKPHPAAVERLDGKKFLLTFVDGPTLSDGIAPLRTSRLRGYIDNFDQVDPAQAIVELHAMQDYLRDIEQYRIDTMRKLNELKPKMFPRLDPGADPVDPSPEQKRQYNIISNQAEAARDEITSLYAHIDVMAKRALPEIKRVGTEVQDKIAKAWAKAYKDIGVDTGTLNHGNVRHASPDELIKAFPHDRKMQDLHDEYRTIMATPPPVVPEPKRLPTPKWVKVPRQFTRVAGYPAASHLPVTLNRWSHEELRDWHNSQDALPGDTEWRSTDGSSETSSFRWVSAEDYKTMVNDAWRLGRAAARTEQSNRSIRQVQHLRDRAKELLPDRRKIVHDVLKSYRPFGGEVETINKRTGKGQKHLQSEAKYIPTDWIETSNDYGQLIVYSDKSKRGHYNHDNEDGASRVQAEVGYSSRAHVTLHEFAHRVEHTNPVVTALERHFYDERTKGEPLQSLQKLQPGHRYKAHEKARPDDFIDPYKGKAYGRRGEFRTQRVTGQYWSTEAYELLSMGIYDAYTLKYNSDLDFMGFIYGLMVTA